MDKQILSEMNGRIRGNLLRWTISVLLGIFPTPLIRPLANAVGHRLQAGARIGFSLVGSRQISMSGTARIGHLNLVNCDRLLMRSDARIGNLNWIAGPLNIWLQKRGAVGSRNVVTRSARGTSSGPAVLRLGNLSKVTAGHTVDCTQSVLFGPFSVLAGKGSQIWTHGYVHDLEGPGRYRIDGKVRLGNNVYIGSRAIITGGISIGDGAIVAAGMSIGRSLPDAGFYVSAPMRKLPRPARPQERDDLIQVDDTYLVETVYRKTHARH